MAIGAAAAVVALAVSAPAAQAATRTTAGTASGTAEVGALADPCWQSGGRWWCVNVAGAPVFQRGTNNVVVGYMAGSTSYFHCRKEGARNNNGPHPNRWAWTKAGNGALGWLSDGDIYSETNPLPTCTF
jgi:hypothetical protein